MNLPFELNGKTFLIAGSWEDLTVGQTIDLLQWATGNNDKDLVTLASIVSTLERSELMDLPYEIITKIAAPAYNFIIETKLDKEEWSCPGEFSCGGNVYKTSIDPGNMSYGCMEIFEKTISNDQTNFCEKIPLMIAALIYKGKFKDREIEARKEIENIANNEVMNMPVFIAYPVSAFFLIKLQHSVQKQREAMKVIPSSKPELEFSSWKSLVNSVRFIRSQKATR
jgi:hypothetical protein